MAALTFVAGDTAPSFSGTASVGGVALDLTTATSVRFQMRPVGVFAFAVDAAATIVTAATGSVRYDWVAGDLSDAGDYVSRWEVLWTDLTVEHTEP